MKGKFRILGHTVLGLLLVCALMLAVVPAVPATADVSSATVVLDDSSANTAAKYTITFTTGKALTTTSHMYFRFPSDTTITDSSNGYDTAYIDVSVDGATATHPANPGTITSNEIDVLMGGTWSASAGSSIEVKFRITSDFISNPSAAGDYKLRVHTTEETTPVLSAAYTITGGPTKIVVTPANIVTAKATASPKITIQLQNADDEPTPVTSPLTILLTKSGSGSASGQFSESATPWSAVTQVTIAAGSHTAYAYYKQTDEGDGVTLTFAVFPTTGFSPSTDAVTCDVTAATQNVDVFDALGVYAGTGNHYTTIAEAYSTLGAANYTLKVRPGVYVGTDGSSNYLNFNTYSMTLESYDGADTTFINVPQANLAEGHGIEIDISGTSAAKPFKIGGDTADSGFTIMANSTGVYAIHIGKTTRRDHVTIQNNKILCGSFTSFYHGISGAADYLTIKNNTIEVASKAIGVYLDAGSAGAHEHLKIEDNTFEPVSDVDGGGVGVFLDTGVDVSTDGQYFYIRGNTFNKAGCAIEVSPKGSGGRDLNGGSDYNFVISQNTITNCTGLMGGSSTGLDSFPNADAAIVFHSAWNHAGTAYNDIKCVLIEKNIITGTSGTGTSGYGVNVIEGAPAADNITGPITIRYNNIYDNAGNGVYSNEYQEAKADVATVANMNWWGAAGGPNATGGDGVTTASGGYYYVTCTNWATQEIVNNLNAGIGLSKTLSKGWNIVSVPLAMDTSADTIADQVSLGHLAKFSVGYTYDPDEVSPWVTISNDTVLTPCNAYYVKVTAADTLGLISSSERGVAPTKTLAAGWNLVSLAYLHPTSPSLATGKDIDDSLVSLGTYATVVVSPSFNTSAWSDVQGSPQNDFLPGEGYWVYMTAADKILAGFSCTPFFSVTWASY